MNLKQRPTYLRYGVAIATVLLALVVTHYVPWLWQRESLVLFFGAVTFSAWYGGRGPGFLACVLAAVVTNVLVYEPAFTVTLTAEALIPLAVFLAVASLISSLTANLARSERQSREHEERLRSMATQHSLTEERGRRAIATGLHDRVGQSLALTRIKLSTLRDDIGDPKLAGELDDVVRLMRDVLTEVKTLTFELSPPILYELGLDAALEWLIGNFKRQYNLECEFQREGPAERLPQETEIVLFQTARELLTNIVKHAPAARATLKVIHEPGGARLIVTDDGQATKAQPRPLAINAGSGFGLFSIRERICHLGGTFELASPPGRGTCVSVSLPTIVGAEIEHTALGPAR